MRQVINIVGKKYNRLTVIARNGYKYKKFPAWLCRCDCGNYVTLSGSALRSGHTKSCGCLQKEAATKHGLCKNPIYRVWAGMMSRCGHRPGGAKKNLKNYKDRGIKVCPEWHNVKNFIAWATENGWEKGLEIDRDNNIGNYEPDNCRFVTRKVNMQNSRSAKRWNVNGKWYLSLRDAAKELNLSYERIRQICQGYTTSSGYTYKPKPNCRVVALY